MTKQEKLLDKLKAGTIDAKELRTLLGKMGWEQLKKKGTSHEKWTDGKGGIFMLATHGKDLKPYQIKEAQQALDGGSNEKDEKTQV